MIIHSKSAFPRRKGLWIWDSSQESSLLGAVPYPLLRQATFESMIFRTSPVGICYSSLEGTLDHKKAMQSKEKGHLPKAIIFLEATHPMDPSVDGRHPANHLGIKKPCK